MIRIRDLSLAPGEDESNLWKLAAKLLRKKPGEIQRLSIYKKSIDARNKSDIRIRYTVDVAVSGENRILQSVKSSKLSRSDHFTYTIPTAADTLPRPLVVGFGPAGMFAALVLAEAGAKPIVIERGDDVQTRQDKAAAFWAGGALDPESNVQFGAGGAGTFSDGKLNTGTHDKRIMWVLQQLCKAGAQPNILYDAMPHVGTDILANIVKSIDNRIRMLGGEIRYRTKLESLILESNRIIGVETNCGKITCSDVILAIGHSARDTVQALYDTGIPMQAKAFSMGVRIEHSQQQINQVQYGTFCNLLPPANYKLACHLDNGDSAYTFCMCPGGHVVAAASEEGGIVTNGMSYSARDGQNANSALLVTLHPEDFPETDALSGMRWQRKIEQTAYAVGGGNYKAPAQTVGDFIAHRPTVSFGSVHPTYQPGVIPCDLHDILPGKITSTLEQALPVLGQKLQGFDLSDAVLTAPETRSSSPVRILRNASLQSEIKGLYPCGEGAGYAGGIVSAAVDGMRCAEAVLTPGI